MSLNRGSWDLYKEGMTFEWCFNISKEMMETFATISNDHNPIHHDESFAQKKGYEAPIVYGAILLAQVSKLVGQAMPDQNAILISLKSNFINPAFIGQPLIFNASINQLSESTHIIYLKWRISNSINLISKGSAEALWKP